MLKSVRSTFNDICLCGNLLLGDITSWGLGEVQGGSRTTRGRRADDVRRADDIYRFLCLDLISVNIWYLPGGRARTMARGRRRPRAHTLLYFILFWWKLPVFLAENWLKFTQFKLQMEALVWFTRLHTVPSQINGRVPGKKYRLSGLLSLETTPGGAHLSSAHARVVRASSAVVCASSAILRASSARARAVHTHTSSANMMWKFQTESIH